MYAVGAFIFRGASRAARVDGLAVRELDAAPRVVFRPPANEVVPKQGEDERLAPRDGRGLERSSSAARYASRRRVELLHAARGAVAAERDRLPADELDEVVVW